MGHSVAVKQQLEDKRQAKGSPTVSWGEIAKHKQNEDCWIVISGVVYDVTEYMSRHPGGKVAILKHKGKDCTSYFENVSAHSDFARNNLPKLYVADVGSSLIPSFGGVKKNSKKKNGQNEKEGTMNACSCVLS